MFRCSKKLLRFGVDLEQGVNRAEVEEPGQQGDESDQADPADAAVEKNNQAQEHNAQHDPNPAVGISNILFHKITSSFYCVSD